MPTKPDNSRGSSWAFRPWQITDEPVIKKALAEFVERAEQDQISAEEALERLSEAVSAGVQSAMDESGRSIAKRLRQTEARMIAEHERERRSFEHRLRWVWGDTLNRLYAIIVSCQEIGAEFNDSHRPDAAEEQDHRFEALTLIHARACLTASEIHALLRSGFPFGARARWRTLHELAVIAAIIGEGDDDLANRFLVHSDVEAYKDALLHNEACPRTGYDPYPEEEVTQLRDIYDAALVQFGNSFRREWGWASQVTAPEPPNFKLLEKRAQLDHRRPDYRESSHLLHSGSSGAIFIRRPFRDGEILLAGPTNVGLGDPAHATAIALGQVTNELVIHGRDYDYHPLVVSMLRALQVMTDELGEHALKAAERVDGLEAAFRRAEQRGRWALVILRWKNRCLRTMWKLSLIGCRLHARLLTTRISSRVESE